MIYSIGTRAGYIQLKCEDCGSVREVRRVTPILEKSEHPCRACSNRRNGEAKIGKYSSWNSGYRKPQSERSLGGTYVNHSGYLEMWIGTDSEKYGRKDGYVLVHRKVAQDTIGRSLSPKEVVHHIDGNKLNNDPTNLLVCNSMSEHRDIHNNLEEVAFWLVQSGLIEFNTETKTYQAPSFGDERMELREFRERLRPEKL